MPLFALPLAPHTAFPNSRTHLSSLPSRKRKRTPSPSPPSSPASDYGKSSFAASNPINLTPTEVAQFKLAGLALDEEPPYKTVEDFPHRSLPEPARSQRDGKEKDREKSQHNREEAGNNENSERRSGREGLRVQHLAVLTAILHKSLLANDIPRASRAWAMLIRAQVGGHAVDLRGSGYWGIGAELLIRGRDGAARNFEEDTADNEDGDEMARRQMAGERRWGTKEGLEKAKDYYERLILQFPYKRQFHGSVNALDFWPAMVGCEIYGIQWEEREGLRKVAEAEDGGEDSGSENEDENERESDFSEHEGEDPFETEERKKIQRRKRRDESYVKQRDQIRQTALVESEKIAARLDDLMTSPPYSDSHVLIRIRGMLALYIGDLSVPARPTEEINNEDPEAEIRNQRRGLGGKESERRIMLRHRLIEHQRGKEKQVDERRRAMSLFEKINNDGGRSVINLDVLQRDDQNEEHYEMDD